MLYLLPNQSNTIVVTWSQRATNANAAYYLLITRHIETQVEQTIIVPKSSNLSQYTQRYDRFTIATQFTREGQYEYTCYEATGTNVSTCIAVVDSGLILVKTTEQSYLNPGGEKQYAVFAPAVTPSNPAPAPIIITTEGIYSGFVSVQVSGTVSGNIYYTTDGTTPSSQNGTLYDDNNRPVLTATSLFQARLYSDGFTLGNVASAYYTIIPVDVVATPSGGTFIVGALSSIVLESNQETADIYYTTDGSEPTTGSTLYSAAIPAFDRITTLKARAFAPPAAPSAILTESYQMKANAPTLDTASGTYISSRTIVATNPNPSGTIEYNINASGWIASGAVTITESASVAFRVVASGLYVTSEETSVAITIQCAAPTISPVGGSFEESLEIIITTNEAGGSTYYTTDGTTPTEASTLYTEPFQITSDAQVRARTFRSGTSPSDVDAENYTAIVPTLLMTAQNEAQLLYITDLEAVNPTPLFTRTLSPQGNVLGFAIGGEIGYATQAAVSAIVNYTNDFGASFTNLGDVISSSGNVYLHQQSMSENLVDAVIDLQTLSGENNVFITKNGGQTWVGQNPLGLNLFLGSRTVSRNGQVIVIGIRSSSGGGVLVSIDGGDSWNRYNVAAGTQDNVRSAAMSDDGSIIYFVLALGSTNAGCYKSTDFGVTWTQVFVGAAYVIRGVRCSSDGQRVYVWSGDMGTPYMLVSTDAGVNYTQTGTIPLSQAATSTGTETGFAISKTGKYIVVGLGGSSADRRPYYTSDFGDTWRRINPTNGTAGVISHDYCAFV